MVNKVTLVGRLGKDPELKAISSTATKCTFSLATDETFKDRDGKKQARTEWHNVVAWGKLAETCHTHLSKGRLIFVEGSIRTESWEDKETRKTVHRTTIIASDVKFLDRARTEELAADSLPDEVGQEVPF